MARPLLDDGLWQRIAPLLPPHKVSARGGRPWADDRRALEGILFVLKTGIGWEHLPAQFGCCGMTCWRRLRDWNAAGVWQKLHQVLLDELRGADLLDWSRAVVDSSSVRALKGGSQIGPNAVDRGRNGSKHHVLTDARGTPLAVSLTGANRHDITQLMPLVCAIPAVGGKAGAPRRRPTIVQADRAYSSDRYRAELRAMGIKPLLSRRHDVHGSGLGVHRWVVERTISWLHQAKRLRVRWEVRDDMHEAFLKLRCALICWSTLKRGLS
ncbi:IS5 family transposase [Planctomycetales bacterium ZRK34]|nr:IS5 family transposase [Planctomycetales bacterium ZRK34]QNN22067.1 IS5 family transposase [Planctomycetales bacterium ZRK34]QNN22068.1 IS5 family transposase [Planctomycetales bacterium ZRK34]QNN22590.1 IS5 family transposase [Planctomycetales bacterium ZRK34]QNN22668.1 IS5 family transposase [Planctomycetales bacterium ZRK34]